MRTGAAEGVINAVSSSILSICFANCVLYNFPLSLPFISCVPACISLTGVWVNQSLSGAWQEV